MADNPDARADAPDFETPRALGDVPQERRCLRCRTAFWSTGFGERICKRCKGLNIWRNATFASASPSQRR